MMTRVIRLIFSDSSPSLPQRKKRIPDRPARREVSPPVVDARGVAGQGQRRRRRRRPLRDLCGDCRPPYQSGVPLPDQQVDGTRRSVSRSSG